ncbi:MAG TPA: hypothetical protein GXZ24_01390 [Firmicutes bacterium]|nr:hypothetical protein [Bacillota bacterium]
MAPGKKYPIRSIVFFLLWMLLVLYPCPADLATSIYRLFAIPTDPLAVEKILSLLPNREDPALVERFILQSFPYRFDWLNYNRPWYFPTAEEAMEKGAGDCKTRFIILASTLEALDIPYEFFFSPSHIWVYYEGKKESSMENRKAALVHKGGDKLYFRLPKINWQENMALICEAYWFPMPPRKKIALLCGFIFSLYLYQAPGISPKPSLP